MQLGGETGEKMMQFLLSCGGRIDNGEHKELLPILEEFWKQLPEPKYQYDESYLIVLKILESSLVVKDVDTMNKWIVHILYADPERIDSGAREMWAGRVAYESNRKEEALKYFSIANKKSRGRCFYSTDKEYKKFFLENIAK